MDEWGFGTTSYIFFNNTETGILRQFLVKDDFITSRMVDCITAFDWKALDDFSKLPFIHKFQEPGERDHMTLSPYLFLNAIDKAV